MAFINAIGCSEGLSNSRPPLFDGINFATWKIDFAFMLEVKVSKFGWP